MKVPFQESSLFNGVFSDLGF